MITLLCSLGYIVLLFVGFMLLPRWMLGFIGCSVWGRTSIPYWGRRGIVLLVFGLVICCFAAARDGLDKTIQHALMAAAHRGCFHLSVCLPSLAVSAHW